MGANGSPVSGSFTETTPTGTGACQGWSGHAATAATNERLSTHEHTTIHPRSTLYLRMKLREAKHLDTENWTGLIKPGPLRHEIDDGKMAQLAQEVTSDVWGKTRVQPPLPAPRWDQRQINELHKQGGRIAAIIDSARTTTRGDDVLDLKRKPPVEAVAETDGKE